jgi:two-component system OmpR family sensor kinase
VTLRLRLLLVLVGVVAAGLVISDVVTYTSLRSFLISRTESQVKEVSFSVSRVLLTSNGYAARGTTGGFAGRPAPTALFPARPGATRPQFVSPGTVGELVRPDGRVVGRTLSSLAGSAVAAPSLPNPLPKVSGEDSALFSSASSGPKSIGYEVLIRSAGVDGLDVVVAVPLTDVNQTLNQLLFVMLLVSSLVLLGLGFLAWWIVRRGLRPLEDMATTAGAIAGGDLGQRVDEADDRTEVGRLGVALNAMLENIEVAFAARAASENRLRRFLADASHELRTPLTSIRGYAEIFDLGARDRPADLASSMHHIREEAVRMNVLVDDLLLLARLDQERPLHLAPTDVVEVVAKAVTAARAISADHRVEFVAPGPLVIECDKERVRQVLDNLLANALRYAPADTAIEVSVESGDGVIVEVADHGPGIAPADTARIFEPFYRADRSRARVTGGAGLGLAIVAAIARAHGGSVGVRRNNGGGARFWVHLPSKSPVSTGPFGAPDPTTAANGHDHSRVLPTGNSQQDQRGDTNALV